MGEYKYLGLTFNNKLITGTIPAKNPKEAKKKVKKLAETKKFILKSIQAKKVFIYKVRNEKGKIITGEEEAYSKEELLTAFKRAGLEVISLRKKLINFQFKPPLKEIVMFVRMSADLIREKLSFDQILNLLYNDTTNKTMKKVIKDIKNDLKDGKEAKLVYQKQEAYLGKFTAYMLGMASTSGNMAEIYEHTAKFLERKIEFKKALRSALIMPSITLLALIGTVIFYVSYIFPKTAEMFERFKIKLPPMTKATLEFSHFLQKYILYMIIAFVFIVLVLLKYFTSEKGKIVRDKLLLKIPLLGPILHRMSIEIFCRVFHCLYNGSGNNMEAIKVSAEACNNAYIEEQIKKIAIPMMLKKGKGLIESLKATGVFPENALSILHSGAETGNLRRASLQIANIYEKETNYKLKNLIDWIQVTIAILITIVLIALTIVSSETAIVKPPHPATIKR